MNALQVTDNNDFASKYFDSKSAEQIGQPIIPVDIAIFEVVVNDPIVQFEVEDTSVEGEEKPKLKFTYGLEHAEGETFQLTLTNQFD